MITVSIVEDNEQFRAALETIIGSQDDFVLSGTYDSAEKAIAGLAARVPDIVIVDITLPGIKGTELIQRMRDKLPGTQFMVCSIHDDNERIFEALEKGASGYILKDPVTAADIVRAVRDLYQGGSPMSPYIARKVISRFQKPPVSEEEALLSMREKEVLDLIAKGLLYKEIANRMGVTHETVKKHLKNIYQKLHVQNKIEALNKYKGF